MSELERKVRCAAAQMRVGWDNERARRVEQRLLRRQRRRAMARTVAGVALAVALVLGAGLRVVALRVERRGATAAHGDRGAGRDAAVQFADGSTASPIGAASVIRLASSSPTRTVVELRQGGARFAVTKQPTRLFRVEAGRVAVEVLGTRFLVERSAERARVEVAEGRVRVLWPGGQRELTAGDAGTFPPEPSPTSTRPEPAPAARLEAPSPSARLQPAEGAANGPRARAQAAAAPAPTWRDLAQEGDFDRAYELLAGAGSLAVSGEPAELLQAADVARLSHHPAQAVAPLRQLLRDHATDPRAPLAAFTLGRCLLEELGQPVEAARAFAKAQSLAPEGPLVEDALAREVEAWSRAGDAAAARGHAQAYVRQYPNGRRLRAVRRFGGLE